MPRGISLGQPTARAAQIGAFFSPEVENLGEKGYLKLIKKTVRVRGLEKPHC
jgi:hypothetical protein